MRTLKNVRMGSERGNMRPKGSPEKLESRRRQAAKMLARGKGIREVARQIGAAPSSVKRWKDALEHGGSDALKSKPHTGRPSRLSRQQRQQLARILEKGPRAAKLRAEYWTCGHVRRVIRRAFGIRYHADHVSRILRSLGWKYRKTKAKSRSTVRQKPIVRRQWVST